MEQFKLVVHLFVESFKGVLSVNDREISPNLNRRFNWQVQN